MQGKRASVAEIGVRSLQASLFCGAEIVFGWRPHAFPHWDGTPPMAREPRVVRKIEEGPAGSKAVTTGAHHVTPRTDLQQWLQELPCLMC